ncbi:MAG: DUF4156 domain-containing protein [Pseudomonadales bacterium]
MRLALRTPVTAIKKSTAIRTSTAAALMIALLGSGCTWIHLTDAGAGVAQANASQVANCRQVGSVTSSTPDKVGVKRGRGKVAEELIVLARNEAANVGGDTIVPAGPAVDGRQDFHVYRCGS